MNEIEEKVLRYKEFANKKPIATVDVPPASSIVISHKILETDGSWKKFDKDGNRVIDGGNLMNDPDSFKVLGLSGLWQYFDYNNNEITKNEYEGRM